jgi:hypothetical protein
MTVICITSMQKSYTRPDNKCGSGDREGELAEMFDAERVWDLGVDIR